MWGGRPGHRTARPRPLAGVRTQHVSAPCRCPARDPTVLIPRRSDGRKPIHLLHLGFVGTKQTSFCTGNRHPRSSYAQRYAAPRTMPPGTYRPKGSGSPSARFRKRASTSIWCRRLGHQLGLPPTTGLLSPTSPCSRSSWRPWAHRIDGVTGRGAAGACPVQHRRLQSSCGSVGTNRRAATECAWRICVSG